MSPKSAAAKPAENIEELKTLLRHWQTVEDASVANCAAIIEKTKNPLIQLVMEIIQRDSEMHRKVQQTILDSLEVQAISLSPEELGEIWDMVEKHAQVEKHTIELAEQARKNCRLFVQRHLLGYLLEDEKKHDRLLEQLEDFKRGIYPYA